MKEITTYLLHLISFQNYSQIATEIESPHYLYLSLIPHLMILIHPSNLFYQQFINPHNIYTFNYKIKTIINIQIDNSLLILIDKILIIQQKPIYEVTQYLRQMKNRGSIYENCFNQLMKSYRSIKSALQEYNQKYGVLDETTYQIWTDDQGIKKILIQYEKTLNIQQSIRQKNLATQIQKVCVKNVINPHIKNQKKQIIFNSEDQFSSQSKSIQLFLHDKQYDYQNQYQKEKKPIEQQSIIHQDKVSHSSYQRGPYKSYTSEQKQRAVNLFQKNVPITKISKMMNIPCKNIKRWSENGIDRKKGAGRKRLDPQMEEKLYNIIKNSYQRGDELQLENLQNIAISLSKDSKFKASKGWLLKFLHRYQIKDEYIFV